MTTENLAHDRTATSKTKSIARALGKDERGATAIEYGLMASLIAVACITAFILVGGNSTQGWQGVANKASAAMK